MPLSDAARALLRGLGRQQPAPEPEPAAPEPEPVQPAPQPAAAGPGGKPKRTDTFRDRAKREEERFRLATDSEYWFTLQFRTPAAAAAFTGRLGLALHGEQLRYVSGPELAAATEHAKAGTSPAARAKQMLTARSTRGADITGQLASKPVPDPLSRAATATGDLETDSAAEFTALMDALTAEPDPNPASIYDTPHRVLVCWPNRDAKDAYLNGSGLEVLGDKYLDGYQAARILGVELPKEG